MGQQQEIHPATGTPIGELGEGLSLNGASGKDSHWNSKGGERGGWPVELEQLERIKQESRVSAQVGQNVVLNCAVQFKDGLEKPFVVNWLKYPHKLPIYIWYAGYPAHVAPGYENRVTRIGQASLNLSRVRESDQGLYECKIYYLDRRPDDEGKGTWLFLDVQAPPHFTQSPAPISYVQAGNSLQLTCQAESTPAPVLRWYKNKLPIDADSGPYKLVSSSNSNLDSSGAAGGSLDEQEAHQELLGARQSSQLELHIEQVLAGTTTGEYRCLASNSEGSVEARAQVALAVPAVITTVPKNQSKLEGERAELQCQAKALPANITHKWLFNEKPIQTLKWFESRYSIRRDGTLVINSLHRDDQGRYTCQASNGIPHGNTARTSGKKVLASANLYAEASAFLSIEYPARVSQSPSPQYLPLGLSGLIRCFVQAAPPVEFFTWTLNNQQFEPNLDPNIERLTNGSLLVRKVLKHYEGSYRCTPFNKHGSAGSSAAMDIRVEEPPVFELRPAEFYKAPAGGHVSIPCEGRGSPRPTVTWRRVTGSSSMGTHLAQRLESSSSSQLLSAQNASPSSLTEQIALIGGDESDHDQNDHDPGEIQMASSSSSSVSSNSATRQLDEPSQPSQQDDEEQQSVIVHAPLPSDRSDFKNSHLLIHGLKKEDHGRYECLIENEVATLIASTMLYIEETTPHAPTDVQVNTKAWSAQVSWRPGYDGGFDQSFVIRYKQVAKFNNQKEEPKLPSAKSNKQQQKQEPVDLNWHSAQVSGDVTTFTVQNLSQDTSYEFYVNARNIIGEGPRSQSVFASTKRAISGSITPIISGESIGSGGQEDKSINDEEQQAFSPSSTSLSSTINPSILGIIHLVDYSSSSSTPNPSAQIPVGVSSVSESNHHTNGHSIASSTFLEQNNSSSTTSDSELELSATPEQQFQPSGNSSKVIRIYLPHKANSRNSSSSSSVVVSSSPAAGNDLTGGQQTNKRPRFDQPDSTTSSLSTPTQAPSVQLDEAPHNLSLSKVAQGWVLSWSPPKRFPLSAAEGSSLATEVAAATSQAGSIQSGPNQNTPSSIASYTLEFREKGGAWQNISASKERSLLLKDLQPGSEYTFRLFAESVVGIRGPHSLELKYTLPDNRRKPSGIQALSAGVVSGSLFFIACIVIAVCAVNICNKRRKKRAEKAAYVMMACPVLESHHDIAALNSNSLMKNSSSSKSGVSGVILSLLSVFRANLSKSAHNKTRTTQVKEVSGRIQVNGSESSGDCSKDNQLLTRQINFSANKAHPVDVAPSYLATEAENSSAVKEALNPPHLDEPDHHQDCQVNQERKDKESVSCWSSSSSRPLDDYWLHKPADRKWGTLTVAGSRLAERRAREASLRLQRNQLEGSPDLSGQGAGFASLTLPRPFRQPAVSSQQQQRQLSSNGVSVTARETSRREADEPPAKSSSWRAKEKGEEEERQFSCWLREQLVGGESANQRRPQASFGHPAQGEAAQVDVADNSREAQPGNLSGQLRLDCLQHQQLHHYQLQPGKVERPATGHQRRSLSGGQLDSLRSALQARTLPVPSQQRHNFNDHTTTGLALAPHLLYLAAPATQQHQQQQQMLAAVQVDSATFKRLSHHHHHHQQQQIRQAGIAQPASFTLLKAAPVRQQQQLSYLIPGRRSLPAGHKSPPTCQSASNWPEAACYPPGTLQCPSAADQQQQQQQLNDDPLTLSENACLGSYKRKHRLPHIEAQFTINSPPEMRMICPGNLAEQTSNLSHPECDLLERGSLFVRPDLPPGYPTPGQRTEQLRLKQQLQSWPFAAAAAQGVPQVACMDTREKIETYLRRYNNPSSVSPLQHHYLSTREKSSLFTPTKHLQPEELIFQPYENLPNLKYSIILPIHRGPDGSLVLNETTHIRRSGRNFEPAGERTLSSTDDSTSQHSSKIRNNATSTAERPPKSRRSKRRLGSSSSCPEPEFESHSRNIPTIPDRTCRLKGRSLESALEQDNLKATLACPSSPLQPDSLETSLENPLPAHLQPTYLCRETASPPDLDGLRASLLREIPPPPAHSSTPSPSLPAQTIPPHPHNEQEQPSQPPPVPPHRIRPGSLKVDSKKNCTKQEQSSSSSSPGAASSTSSSLTGNGTSEALTNEHSVDENYEFDLISSCSSSIANRNKHQQISTTNSNGSNFRQQNVNGDIYSQVNKQRRKQVDNNKNTSSSSSNPQASHHPQSQRNERARFYLNSNRKEQQITTANRPTSSSISSSSSSSSSSPSNHVQKLINQINHNNNPAYYYDTVYDDIRDDQSKPGESSRSNYNKNNKVERGVN